MIILVDSAGIRSADDHQGLLRKLEELGDHRVIILTRGLGHDWSPHMSVPFPSYEWDRCNAADSKILEQFCQQYAADVMISTAWTTPLSTPAIMVPAGSLPLPGAGREASELKLALAYCHAAVIDGSAQGRWTKLVMRRGRKCPVLDDIASAVSAPHRSDEFYREWQQLRLAQGAVDTKVWSRRRGPEYGACAENHIDADDADKTIGLEADWEEEQDMRQGEAASSTTAHPPTPSALDTPEYNMPVVRTAVEEDRDPVRLFEQVRRLQLENDDLRLDRNRHRASAARFQRELTQVLEDLEATRSIIEVANQARDEIVVLARDFDDRLAREIGGMEERYRIERAALSQRLSTDHSDALRREIVSLAIEIEAKLAQNRTMDLDDTSPSKAAI